MLAWLAKRAEPLLEKLVRKIDYPRLTLWKAFLFKPHAVLKKPPPGGLWRGISDITISSLWYFAGLFWLITLLAWYSASNSITVWIGQMISKSIVIALVLLFSLLGHWLATNAFEYVFFPPARKPSSFGRQAYLSALGFGAVSVLLMALQIIGHALALLSALGYFASYLSGDQQAARFFFNLLWMVFSFGAVFFPLLTQIARVAHQKKILSRGRPLAGAPLAFFILIEFLSLFAFGYIAASVGFWALGVQV